MSRSFTVGSGMRDELGLGRFPENCWGQMSVSQEGTRLTPLGPSMPPARAPATIADQPDRYSTHRRQQITTIREQNDDFYVGPLVFPELPNPEKFEVLRILSPERHRMVQAGLPAITAPLLPDEPRVKMEWNVQELKRLNFERTGIREVSPPQRDLSEIPGFKPENAIPTGRRARKRERSKRVPKGKSKVLKTRHELNQRVASERTSKLDEDDSD